MPDANTLLDAAIKYLEEELLPELSGYHRFKTRVMTNVLITLRRELKLSAAQAATEHDRLIAILGHDGTTEELSLELADAIRSGSLDPADPAILDHVRKSLREALAINNPKWISS
jgi:uncharacterized protein YcaQ